MKISLEQIGKKYYRHWIIRNVNFTFSAPQRYAVIGENGSGKSTFLRMLAGMLPPSKGKIIHQHHEKIVEDSKLFHQLSFCAPALELIEEMTLREFFHFHFTHKKPLLSIEEIIAETGLEKSADKMIGDFSSGMKQRVKLAQAIFADTPLLLLDEPCTNLDEAGVTQYHSWIKQFCNNKLVVVASNDKREYSFCNEIIKMAGWQ